jgi:hypothetical protein
MMCEKSIFFLSASSDKILIMEKAISHFDKHGKMFRGQLITVSDFLEFKRPITIRY